MRNSKPKTLPGGDCPAAIPEELIMSDILLKISDGASMARCRCVCRSWRDFLSTPSLIRHKFRSPLPHSPFDYEMMIMGSGPVQDDGSYSMDVYRWYSPDTLEPLHPNYSAISDLVCEPASIRVAGYSNGLFCLSVAYSAHYDTDLVLWNPTTSETKVLPPSSHTNIIIIRAVGFGFDSEKNDYKIFRHFIYCDQSTYQCMEVYSLRKDSWRSLEGYYPGLLSPQIPTYHKDKLYWFELGLILLHKSCLIFHTFDIGSEALERIKVPFSVAVEDQEHMNVYECMFGEKSMITLLSFEDHDSETTSWEIWMLLKYWDPESWIKLFVIPVPPTMKMIRTIGLPRNMRLFFVGEIKDGRERLIAFDIERGELEDFFIDQQEPYRIVAYIPSQVSLKKYQL